MTTDLRRAASINDLVAEIVDRFGGASAVDYEEIERLVREERTERYEDHDAEALRALFERVVLRIDPHAKPARW